MFERVTIVGAGVAGCAAAWAAAQRGAEIRLFDAGVGATSLSGGAVDDRPWEEIARSAEILGASAIAGMLPTSLTTFARDLDLWHLPDAGAPLCRLATEAGRVRVARGHERSLIDLARLPRGARILLPRLARPEWHPESLARSLEDDAYAREKGYRFEVVDATILKHAGEDRIAHADLAARHDDPVRRGWLVERLRELIHRADGADAVLMGPWLGAEAPIAPALEQALGVPVGEILPAIGGAVGLRYEAARDRLLSHVGVAIDRLRVTAIEPGAETTVTLADGDRVTADAVVVAIGGLASGGVIYDPPEYRAGPQYPDAGGQAFRLSVALGGVAIQAGGRHLDVVGSLHGPPLEATAWPRDVDPGFLEAVGVRTVGLEIAPRVFAAGDVVADKPRTILQAAFHGIHAGAAAAGEPGAIAS